MKKINIPKKIIVCTLTSPLNLISLLYSFLILIHIRASILANKQHIKLESHEKAKKKRK